MLLAVWAFLMCLPIGAIAIIIKPYIDKGLGPHIVVTVIGWLGTAVVMAVVLYVLYRILYALSPRNRAAEREVEELRREVDELKERLYGQGCAD